MLSAAAAPFKAAQLAVLPQVDRLRASGCAVLWLTTDDKDDPFDGVTVHKLTSPTATAQAIGRAATAALRAAH